jgi:hypothetical protein
MLTVQYQSPALQTESESISSSALPEYDAPAHTQTHTPIIMQVVVSNYLYNEDSRL